MTILWMSCWIRLTVEWKTFSFEVNMSDVKFVKWKIDETISVDIFEKISAAKWSFNFWILDDFRFRILDKSKFEFNSADNLLNDIDLAKEIDESEKNDERNWWNKESKNRIENERKEFKCCCDENVFDKIEKEIFLFLSEILTSSERSSFWFESSNNDIE